MVLILLAYFPSILAIDYVMILLDAIVLIGFAIYLANRYSNVTICNQLTKTKVHLRWWRNGLYVAVVSGWLISIFTAPVPSFARFVFHLSFLGGTLVTLYVSIPSWICKKRNLSMVCACDIYEYNDFELMLMHGMFGSFALLFATNSVHALAIFSYLLSVAIILYITRPPKIIPPLKYPPELEIRTVEQLQDFLMHDPMRRKLITLLRSECDFCKLQVEEISYVSPMYDVLRVIDISDETQIDHFLLQFLNFEEPEKIKVPTSLIIENGMSFDRKDGIMTKDEILAILQSGF